MSEMPAMERLRIRLIAERDSADRQRERQAPNGGYLYMEWVGRVLAHDIDIEHLDLILKEQQP